MAVSQAQIDALTVQIAQAERVVQTGDERTEYRSVNELIRARAALIAQQAEETGAAGQARPKQTLVYHGGRGYEH